ncbi:hypothetical protein [Methanobrevibacter sp.]|uniref:hypothetical protein n=1 Tax=Methanobrevibacter sp. TaxID=66852 RepID=UPI0038643B58
MKTVYVVLLIIFIALLVVFSVILFLNSNLTGGIASIIVALITSTVTFIVNSKINKNSKETFSIGHDAKGKGNELGNIEIHSSNCSDDVCDVGHTVDGENIKIGDIKIWKK